MAEKNHQGEKEGYWAGYEKALSRITEAKQGECERLGREWSDGEGKAKKKRCPRCHRWVQVQVRHIVRTVTSRLGEVTYRRHYYYCHKCERGWFPRDVELGLAGEELTGDVLALALDFVVNDPFAQAAQRLELHHGIRRSATGLKLLFQRQSAPLADTAQAAPVVPLPLTAHNAQRPVVIMNDGSMLRHTDGWHEAKLLSVGILGELQRVFLVETQDKERFAALLREAEGFAQLWSRTVLWLADGAAYNWGLQERLCPHAHCLVDYYHVREHLYDCAKSLFGEGDECVELFVQTASRLLLQSRAKEVIAQLKECYLLTPKSKRGQVGAQALLNLWLYLEEHKRHGRLDYRKFLENRWPIGSGAIESAHRWVLQRRMKQPGMKWSPANVQRMATLRALYASVGPSDFYSYLRLAQKEAA